MVENTDFSWVKTHREIVRYLKENQHNQLELIELLKFTGIGPFDNDVDDKGNKTELIEIDPFTFFFFIYKYGQPKRLEFLQKIAAELNLEKPTGDFGIPSANAQKLWLFPYERNRNNNEIERLWIFFFAALESKITNELFADVITIAGVGLAKITEGLFDVDPEIYFPINAPTKSYLKEILKIDPEFKTFIEYENILNQIKLITDKSFYELSYDAWLWNSTQSKDEKIFKKTVAKFSPKEINFYFQFLEKIVTELNLESGDSRIVFSCGKNYLNFNIGQRFVWRLEPKKGLKYHIITDKKMAENSGNFDGKPEHYYYVFREEDKLAEVKESCLAASSIELARTQKSGYRDHNNSSFEQAVFNKIFSSQFLESKPMKEETLNQIFYGPPGTGKTYNTISEALKIAVPQFYKVHKDNRKNLTEQFKNLLITDWKNTNGQIAFCTFHQSFTYEDFVEGIKPVTTIDKNINYEIEPGIFKKICDLAEASKSTKKIKTEGKIDWTDDHFRQASFFKMSLGESTKKEDTEIYEFCKTENYVAIGFTESDLTGKTETEIKEICTDEDLQSTAGSQLSTFIHGMKKGDYVLIGNGNSFVRALGKIVGDYEFHEDYPTSYKHYRAVEWVFKDESIPIEEIYDKQLRQQTIYRIDHEKVKRDFFVKDGASKPSEDEEVKPYVLIIDEINRGNVSAIFGELITLIEKDKRSGSDEELQVVLPYSKKVFSVPDNVYIIGTMNTADRSIEALDSALRRRFNFTEIQPKTYLIKEILQDRSTWNFIDLQEVLETINKRITVLIDREHRIGHSYFLKLKDASSEDFGGMLKAVFFENIIPLMQEYFFNDYVKIGMVLGTGFFEESVPEQQLFAEIEDSLEDDYSDVKIYNFKDLTSISDTDFIVILNKLLNK
ncbi:AAA family ATPase [Kaistella antarctica]|uniref:5-methylcytosine-specific restriction enzyme B n=1 Tax=Kaistella antarctica TaxID=266748 RepID=A0A448NPV0_9FLAO|nr:AAA family ATPase [Kaistella antarctica]SEW05181.1 5-methylcytosine-specific restriction enzyme B [Kaistella antarctica]VEH98517.1 5-methylcytosine-specific restriction enzyme B [Kaistella antarctica]